MVSIVVSVGQYSGQYRIAVSIVVCVVVSVGIRLVNTIVGSIGVRTGCARCAWAHPNHPMCISIIQGQHQVGGWGCQCKCPHYIKG